MAQDKLPLPWKLALLAIVPGLIATLALVGLNAPAMGLGIVLLLAFLAAAFLMNHQQLPGWSLMAAGLLVSTGLGLLLGVVGGLMALLIGSAAFNSGAFLLLMLLGIALWFATHGTRATPRIWAIFAAIAVCHLAVRVKYFVLFGVSWAVIGGWLNISLSAAIHGLLLPVTLGWILSQRYKLQALLFTIGMVYGGFQILIDVNHQVSGQIGGTLGFNLYKTAIPFLFTVVMPLWVLRAPTPRNRIWGVWVLSGLTVMTNLIIVGLSYNGELPLMIWISFIPYTISLLLTLDLAHRLYQDNSPQPLPA